MRLILLIAVFVVFASVTYANVDTNFCAQVITPAVDPQIGVCYEFPTPCDVPDGWFTVTSCSTNQELSQEANNIRHVHFHDNANLVSYPDKIESFLTALEQEKGIVIIIDTEPYVEVSAEDFVNAKYDEYGLGLADGTRLNALIVVDVNSRKVNFRGSCEVFKEVVRKIVLVNNKEPLDKSDFYTAFAQIANDLYRYANEKGDSVNCETLTNAANQNSNNEDSVGGPYVPDDATDVSWGNDNCVSDSSMCVTNEGMCEVVTEDDFNSEYFTPIEDNTVTGYVTYSSAPANEVTSENTDSPINTISGGLSLNLFVVNPYSKVHNIRTNKVWLARLYDANRNAVANGLQNTVHKLSTVIKGDIPETGLTTSDVLFITGHHFTYDHYIWGDRFTSSGIRDMTQKQKIKFLELPYSRKTKSVLFSSCHTVMNPDYENGQSVPILRELLEKNPNLVLVAGFETKAPLLDDKRIQSSIKEVLDPLSTGNARWAAAAWINSIKTINKGKAWSDKNSAGSWNYETNENGYSGAAFFKENGKWYYTASWHEPWEININSNQYTSKKNEVNCDGFDFFNENVGQIRCLESITGYYNKVQCFPTANDYKWAILQPGFTSQDSCASDCKDSDTTASYCTEPRLVVWATQGTNTILDTQTGVGLSDDIIIKSKNENPHQNKLLSLLDVYRIIFIFTGINGDTESYQKYCDLTTTDCEMKINKDLLMPGGTVKYWSEMIVVESDGHRTWIKAPSSPPYYRNYKDFTIRTNPSG